MILKWLTWLALVLFFSTACWAESSTLKQQQITALNTILEELDTHYGMMKFKQEHFAISLPQLKAKYAKLIQEAMTLEEAAHLTPRVTRTELNKEEFEQLLIGLASELRDGHTNILRKTQSYYTVGLMTAAIDGKLYVTGFSKQFQQPESVTDQIKVGDEIVKVNGVAVQELAKSNALYTQSATFEASNDFALAAILQVSHRFFRAKKVGEVVSVEFYREKEKKTIQGRYRWLDVKDYRNLRSVYGRIFPKFKQFANSSEEPPFVYGTMAERRSYFRFGLSNLDLPEGTVIDQGGILNQEIIKEQAKAAALKSSRLQPRKTDGDSVGESDDDEGENTSKSDKDHPISRLEAYSIRYKDKNIGVIRMPSYSPDSFGEVLAEAKWLRKILDRFQNTVDVLIFDQLSNGGGYVAYGMETLKLFASKKEPIKTFKIDYRLTGTLLEALEGWYSGDHDSEDKENFAKVKLAEVDLKVMRDKYEQGEKWSGFVPSMGNDNNESSAGEVGRIFAPSTTEFTKPVLVLNDKHSASCGDMVPAVLKANGRAVLFGEISAGLGGPVYRGHDSISSAEVSMRCTMGYKCDEKGNFIENVGAVPDIHRRITVNDMQDNFKSYSQDVLNAALDLAKYKELEVWKKHLQKEQVKQQRHDSKAMKAIREAIKNYQALLASSNLTLHDQLFGYGLLLDLIQQNYQALTSFEKSRLQIPRPDFIHQQNNQADPIMLNIFDLSSLIERLKQYAALPKAALQRSAIQLLIQKLSDLAVNASTALRMTDQSCEPLLIYPAKVAKP